MPRVRAKELDGDYKPYGKAVSSHSHANKVKRLPERIVAATSQPADVLPFPEGDPTEPVHEALIAFCGKSMASHMLGTIDNLLVWLYFSTKHQTYRAWSLRTSKLPSDYDFQHILRKKMSKPFFNLTKTLQTTPYDQWRSAVDIAVTSVTSSVRDKDFLRVLKSEDFAL
jgi:hypothetical protein